MKVIDIKGATASLSEYVRKSDRETLVVTEGGRPVLALVPLDENMDLETVSLSLNEKFIGIIERSRVRQEAEGAFLLRRCDDNSDSIEFVVGVSSGF